MKKLFLLLMATTALVVAGGNAHAFSTEQRDNTNSDGTPKFADPDEQKPPFLAMPEDKSGNSSSSSYSYPAMRFQNAPGQPDASRQGEDAFDRATSRFGDR